MGSSSTIMQFKPLTIVIAIVSLLLGGCSKDCLTKQTTNPEHLKQLLETNNCPGCNLGDANLSGTNLAGADLSQAELVKAVLDGANLEGANLSQAQFSWYEINTGWGSFTSCEVDLKASLKDVNLTGANLSGANLRDIDLAGVNLNKANLTF